METAIIDRLQQFLLELGKGFLFEARQKRFSFADSHFFVDLVFYNRLLRCHVLIDLKTGKLTHQDLGQMQMYVNYFDRYVKIDGELPTVGILLCDDKNDAVVELTLPEDANIYADLIRPNPDHVAVLAAGEDGGFRPRATLPAPFGPFSVVAADLNGDGRQDVAAASGEGAGSLATWHGLADGSFRAAGRYEIARGPTKSAAD